MTITIGDTYFLVSIPSPTVRNLKWDKENPAKIGQGRAANQKFWDRQKKAYAELREQYRADFVKLKAVGLQKERRFNRQETADRYAAEIERDYGVKMSVCEAADMFL